MDHPECLTTRRNSEATIMVVVARLPRMACRTLRGPRARCCSGIPVQRRSPPRVGYSAADPFDQPVDALVLSSGDLRESMRGADPGLLPILLQHADAVLARTTFDDDFAEPVHAPW